jgi:hypothetical protein
MRKQESVAGPDDGCGLGSDPGPQISDPGTHYEMRAAAEVPEMLTYEMVSYLNGVYACHVSKQAMPHKPISLFCRYSAVDVSEPMGAAINRSVPHYSAGVVLFRHQAHRHDKTRTIHNSNHPSSLIL